MHPIQQARSWQPFDRRKYNKYSVRSGPCTPVDASQNIPNQKIGMPKPAMGTSNYELRNAKMARTISECSSINSNVSSSSKANSTHPPHPPIPQDSFPPCPPHQQCPYHIC